MPPTPFSKPPYINPAGRGGPPDLPSVPPFLFNDVTTRAFPIRANLARLSQFCDDYLNMDQQIVQFRPTIPFVYLLILNYGRLSSASVQARNVGWVSQHEVAFTIPLERWRREGERWVFDSWASVSPFIFVDDELSQTTGREVYGWPKIVGKVQANVPFWVSDPRSPTQVFSLQIPIFPKVFAGAREELRDFLRIDRDPVPRFSEFPPDPGNPWAPWAIVQNGVQSGLKLLGVSLDMAIRSPARGYRESWNPSLAAAMLRAMRRNLDPLLPDFLQPGGGERWQQMNASRRTRHGVDSLDDGPNGESPGHRLQLDTITLKQFRDSHKPEQACYQALISSPMGIERVNRFGLLGDYNLIRGDVSGGYTIRIHNYEVQPIIGSLGLEVAGIEQGDDAEVALLKPVLPFWTDVDLRYGRGEVICSRAQCYQPGGSCTQWQDGRMSGKACPETPASTSGLSDRDHESPQDGAAFHGIPYNTTQGGATQPIAGPFHFPDVTLQVYPLMADSARLQRFLDEYLNQPLCAGSEQPVGIRFEPFGSYVYLMVSVQGGQVGIMWSETNNIGWWADKEVSFCVPVKWYRWQKAAENSGEAEGSWELVSLGMVSPFAFGNTGRAVITDREINGRPTVKATIDSPLDAWLDPSGPIAERRLLTLGTEVFPALHLGQRGEQRTLLEIDGYDAMPEPCQGDEAQRQMMLDIWGEKYLQEFQRKALLHERLEAEVGNACDLTHALLFQDTPFNSLHLKQYRDATEPDKACYQALVKTSRYVTRLYRLAEIEQRIHIRLHKYPGFPIAETLGLKIKHVDSTRGDVIQVLDPIRPFWMRLGLREHLGEVLCWRTERPQWTTTHPSMPQLAAPYEQPFFVAPGRTAIARVRDRDRATGSKTTEPGLLRQVLDGELAAMVQALVADSKLRQALQTEADRMALTDPSQAGGEQPGAPRSEGATGRIRDALRELLAECAAGETSSPPPGHPPPLSTIPLAERYLAVESLWALLEQHAHPPKSERLTRREAQTCIEGIPELQIVLETVLSQQAVLKDDSEDERAAPHYIPGHAFPPEWLAQRLAREDAKAWPLKETGRGHEWKSARGSQRRKTRSKADHQQ